MIEKIKDYGIPISFIAVLFLGMFVGITVYEYVNPRNVINNKTDNDNSKQLIKLNTQNGGLFKNLLNLLLPGFEVDGEIPMEKISEYYNQTVKLKLDYSDRNAKDVDEIVSGYLKTGDRNGLIRFLQQLDLK